LYWNKHRVRWLSLHPTKWINDCSGCCWSVVRVPAICCMIGLGIRSYSLLNRRIMHYSFLPPMFSFCSQS
jgi:hypothetical protein